MMMQQIASICILLLSIWCISWICIGQTNVGREFYRKIATILFPYEKISAQLLCLVLPLLMAGLLATIAIYQRRRSSTDTRRLIPHGAPRWVYRIIQRTRHLDVRQFIRYFVCWPLGMFLITNILRHFSSNNQQGDDDQLLLEISNAFGVMSMVAMSYFLVPVARQSPILKLFQIDPVCAIRIHIWAGRIIIIGVIIHGAMHMYRWKVLAGESILGMLMPPRQCWTMDNNDDPVESQPTCVHEDTDCSCYHHFRNLTGLVGMMALIIIGVTSLNYVRRTYYRLFFMTHVMVAPTALIVIILHWNKAILYMAPSILYYIATSFPVMVENRDSLCRQGGIQVKQVERIESLQSRSCMSITFAATPEAMSMYRAGQYVKLMAPEISKITSHPFTVNRVPNQPNELRIIFRIAGSFTRGLESKFRKTTGRYPTIALDGFHGSQVRLQQLMKHDSVVIVAGGIGITPYLSLLVEAHSTLTSHNNASQVEDAMTKEIVLHWICRDQQLIDYISREYFQPLMAKTGNDHFRIHLIVHNTASTVNRGPEIAHLGKPQRSNASESQSSQLSRSDAAFSASFFSAGSNSSTYHAVIAALTYCAICGGGLWIILSTYAINPAKEEMLARLVSPMCVVVLGLAVSWLARSLIRSPPPGSEKAHNGARSFAYTHGQSGHSNSGDLFEMRTVEPVKDVAKELCRMEEGGNMTPRTVSLDTRQSRPTVHEMFKTLLQAQCPGVFVCGPAGLARDVKDAVVEKCDIRKCQCISDEPNIAFYEEQFEM